MTLSFLDTYVSPWGSSINNYWLCT